MVAVGRCCLRNTNNLTAEHNLGKHRNRRFTASVKEEINRRLRNDDSPVVIAREMGIPVAWINARKYHLRLQRQLPMPETGRPDEEKFSLARQMWDDGKTIAIIAKEYGYNFRRMAGVIEYYRAKHGWFPRRNKERK